MAFENVSNSNIEGNNKIPKLREDILKVAQESLKPANPMKEIIRDINIFPETKAEVLASSLFSGEGRIEPPLSNVEEQLIKLQRESNFFDDPQKLEQLKLYLC